MLAALWAVDDEATEWFMNCFYQHLVRGESASESLHQAMKSMRESRFPDVKQWAPFMLIGDNVTFKGLYLISFLGFLVILIKICEIDVRDTTHHLENIIKGVMLSFLSFFYCVFQSCS